MSLIISGVDIGTRTDHTTIVTLDDWTVTNATQLPLHMTFESIGDWVLEVVAASTHTYMDMSGVGDPIVERIQQSHPNVTGIRFTGGSKARKINNKIMNVPKSLLVNALGQAARRGLLKIDPKAPGAELLRTELLAFMQYNGRTTKYEAGRGHDDLVAALCLAVFGRMMFERTGNALDHTQAVDVADKRNGFGNR